MLFAVKTFTFLGPAYTMPEKFEKVRPIIHTNPEKLSKNRVLQNALQTGGI